MYALITNGVVEKYPYSIGQLRKDNPQTSFPKNPVDSLLAEYGVFPVVRTDWPEHDPIHQRVQDRAEWRDGQAVQVWDIVRREDIPTVADFAAERTQAVRDACGSVILARLPIHRQLNLQRRAIELLDIVRERPLTEAELTERTRITVERDWLEAQRAECNRLEDLISTIVSSEGADDHKRNAIAQIVFRSAT